MDSTHFFIGSWQVEPAENSLRQGKRKRTLEPKAMDVLLLLCQHQGEVVSTDDIVSQCWPQADMGDNPVHKAITQLRRTLDDKASAPQYIETIRKRGYRIIADVRFPLNEQNKPATVTWQNASPYPGLVAFSEKESDIFFGRASATELVFNKLENQRKARHMLTVLLGASGSGKSSLIQAGILPQLKLPHGSRALHCVSDTRIDAADINPKLLFTELASALLDWEIDDSPLFEGYSSESLAKMLASEPEALRSNFEHKLSSLSQSDRQPVCVLFFDRLEAILASDKLDDQAKNTFFHTLDCLATGTSLLVILACRNDFYPSLSQYPVLMRYKDKGGHIDLQPPSSVELSQMIRLPAAAAGLRWDVHSQTGVSLDEQLCLDAVHHTDGLPLLQYTLQELYLQRKDNVLSYEIYHALGGVEGAIGKKAESVYAEMPLASQACFGAVMSKLMHTDQSDERLTGRSVQWAELNSPEERAFVESMVEHRLFVSHLHQEEACFNVAHEALLRRWERVSDWLRLHRVALIHKQRLSQQTQQWLNDDRSSAFLLPQGKPISDALTLRDSHVIPLSEAENALINRSVSQIKQKRRLRQATIFSLICLSLISFVAMLTSMQSQSLAERKREEAEDLMGFMIGDFANTLRSVRRMDLLDGISQRALDYVKTAQQSPGNGLFAPTLPPPSLNLRLQHAQTLQAMGEVSYYRNDSDTALRHFDEADGLLSGLIETNSENQKVVQTAGLNAFWIGQIAFNADKFESARAAFLNYLDLSRKMVTLAPDDSYARLEVAYANSSLGSTEMKLMRFDDALVHFQAALDERLSLDVKDDIVTLTDIADTRSWIASTYLYLGKPEPAAQFYSEAITSLETLHARQPANANILETLAYVTVQYAALLHLQERSDEAVNALKNARTFLSAALSQDPENSTWQQAVTNIDVRLNAYQSSLSLTGEQKQQLIEQAIQRLNTESTELRQRLHLLNSLQNLGQWQQSAALIEKIIASDEQLAPEGDFVEAEDRVYQSGFVINQIRQAAADKPVQDQRKAITSLCNKLNRLSEDALTLSQHPAFIQAYVLAARCLNKTEDISAQENTLRSMNVQILDYPTFNDKD